MYLPSDTYFVDNNLTPSSLQFRLILMFVLVIKDRINNNAISTLRITKIMTVGWDIGFGVAKLVIKY